MAGYTHSTTTGTTERAEMKAENFLPDDYRPAEDEPFMNDRQLEYFRRKLTAQQRNAGQSHICGELLYNGRLADAGCSPDKDRAHNANVQ